MLGPWHVFSFRIIYGEYHTFSNSNSVDLDRYMMMMLVSSDSYNVS